MILSEIAAHAAITAQTDPARWVSLHNGDPGGTGVNAVAGVARKQTTWATPAGGRRGGTQVLFDVPAGRTVTHWGTWTSENGGTFYAGYELPGGGDTFHRAGQYALTPIVAPGEAGPGGGDPGEDEDGIQAAVLRGWGPVVGGDEFDGNQLNLELWSPYDGVGHDENGIRSPDQLSVSGGSLHIVGLPDGTTGGLAGESSRYRGRWETRMRVPLGDFRYHPVLILWPTAEDFPVGGEVDYAETTCASDSISFFLHYSEDNLTTTAELPIDLTEWHNYAVEWDATGIYGYVDGERWFTDTNQGHMPPRAMHPTIQLDWFPEGGTAVQQSSMEVAWIREYDL